MRIVDFKEMCTLPENTLFCQLEHVPIMHATHLGTLYVKMPDGAHKKLSFYAKRLDNWKAVEFSLEEIEQAYMTGESIGGPFTGSLSEFHFKHHTASRFAVWEKKEVEDMQRELQAVAKAFKTSPCVSN